MGRSKEDDWMPWVVSIVGGILGLGAAALATNINLPKNQNQPQPQQQQPQPQASSNPAQVKKSDCGCSG
jgi:L-lactate permease